MPVLFLLLMLLLPHLGQAATTYYVDPAKSNSNPCTGAGGNNATTPAFAKATINGGVGCLAAGAGDTLIIKAGVYDELLLDVIPSGSAGAPTILKSEVQYGAVIRPSAGKQASLYNGTGVIGLFRRDYITFDGLTLDGANLFHVELIANSSGDTNNPPGSGHISIVNMDIKNGSDGGAPNSFGITVGHYSHDWYIAHNKIHHIGADASIPTSTDARQSYGIYYKGQNGIIEDNEIDHCGGYGIHQYNTHIGGGSDGNIIRNNRIHHNGVNVVQQGVLLAAAGANNQFYNNRVYANGDHGLIMGVFGAASANLILNNTFYANPGWCMDLQANSSTISNNICYNNGSDSINLRSGSSGNTTTPNLLGADPSFVNAPTGDFHLQSTSVAAINAGITNSAALFDADNNPRGSAGGSSDAGAYEFISGVTPFIGKFWVSPTFGSTSNDCNAIQANPGPSASPALTIAQAIACAAGTSTICLRAGTYAESVVTGTTPIAAGTATTPTTISSCLGESVILQGAPGSDSIIRLNNTATDHYLTFDQLTLDGVSAAGRGGLNIYPGPANNITLQNSTIHHTDRFAVAVVRGDQVRLASNTLRDVVGSGGNPVVNVTLSTGTVLTGNTVRNGTAMGVYLDTNSSTTLSRNAIYSHADSGVIVVDTTGSLMMNNLIYSNTGNGIDLQGSTTSQDLYNNTIWNNTAAPLQIRSGVATTTYKNNIFTANGGGNAVVNSGTGTVQNNNFAGDPSFTAPGPPTSFTPTSTSVIDQGATIASVTTDFNGTSRTIPYTIGAIEVDSPTPPPLPRLNPPYGTTPFFLGDR